MKHRKINYRRLGLAGLCLLLLSAGTFFGFSRLFSHPEKNLPVQNTASGTADLSTLLEMAKQPLGKVMYIWGGGWNEEDTASGPETRQLGLASSWIEFADAQDASYNFQDHLYEIHNGLDCSGYIGWVLYNTFEHKKGEKGYVDFSDRIGPNLADLGLGTVIPADQIESYEPGDIMANSDHIYLVLAPCQDGSILLIHSSPPGVRLCGTPAADGNPDSQALALARHVMAGYAPDWYAKYPDCTADYSYLTEYDQFRWNTDKIKDENNLRNKSAEEIVSYLFSSLEN